MASIIGRVAAGIRRLASMAVGLLPAPPTGEAAPPDVDGRRPTEADTTALRIDAERKAGRGSYR
jgi:hypothetical protein